MHNKLIIFTFALFFSFLGMAQDGSVVSAERNMTVGSIDAKNTIKLYPNPTVKDLIIQVENSTLKATQIELHSLIGNQIEISPENLGGGKYRVSVENLSSGYYLVVVRDDQSRFKVARKFLKK